jgi:hypothetical protein
MNRNVPLLERDRVQTVEPAIPDGAMLTIAEVAAILGVNRKAKAMSATTKSMAPAQPNGGGHA